MTTSFKDAPRGTERAVPSFTFDRWALLIDVRALCFASLAANQRNSVSDETVSGLESTSKRTK